MKKTKAVQFFHHCIIALLLYLILLSYKLEFCAYFWHLNISKLLCTRVMTRTNNYAQEAFCGFYFTHRRAPLRIAAR